MRRNYFGWGLIFLTVFIGGCSDPKTTTGVEYNQVGTYEKNFTAAKAAKAKWTGYCRVDMVQSVGSWVYLYFRTDYGKCYFRSIRAKGDTGRLWAIIGLHAQSNWDHSGGEELYIQHAGLSVKRLRLCYGQVYGNNCKGMPGTTY